MCVGLFADQIPEEELEDEPSDPAKTDYTGCLPEEDPYDPAKPDYIIAASNEEEEEQHAILRRQQILQLQHVLILRSTGDAESNIMQHYERVVNEMRHAGENYQTQVPQIAVTSDMSHVVVPQVAHAVSDESDMSKQPLRISPIEISSTEQFAPQFGSPGLLDIETGKLPMSRPQRKCTRKRSRCLSSLYLKRHVVPRNFSVRCF